LGYTFNPGQDYWFNNENDHPISGKINKFGWRDKEWAVEKPLNTYRIAVLGDSFVEAFQVESEFTFLKLAEDQIKRELNRNIEFMNFGRSGYTQTEEYIILKNQIFKFSPDMVILFFPGNDISDISKNTTSDLNRPFYNISDNGAFILDNSFSNTNIFKIKKIVNIFKHHSAIVSLISERYNLYKKNKAIRSEMNYEIRDMKGDDRKVSGYLSLFTNHPEKIYINNYKLNKILMQDMAKLCVKNNIKFMIVCCDIYLNKEKVKYLTNIDPSFNLKYIEYDMENFAKSINVEYLGLQSVFMQAYENETINYHWNHWNYEGHKIVADALENKLINNIQINN
jgi:lysophospholipase L1-like esterase